MSFAFNLHLCSGVAEGREDCVEVRVVLLDRVSKHDNVIKCGSCSANSSTSNLSAATHVDPLKTVAREPGAKFPVGNLEKNGWCSLNKRPLNPPVGEESETEYIPRKIHITEEAISTRFSTMDISGANSPLSSDFPSILSHLPTPSLHFLPNSGSRESTSTCSRPHESSMAMLTRHTSTGNPAVLQCQDSDEESNDDTTKPRLRLPQELRKDLTRLKSTGGLCDSDIQILMHPQPCLALVPYTPRIPLLGVAMKAPAPEEDKDETGSDKDAMDASASPPTCIASPPVLPWQSSPFTLSSGTSVQASSHFNRAFSWLPNFAEQP
ncbi:hypothetical protein SprV_0200725000 [Sparganum proliferum]